jgi:hypothetical protein
MPRNPRPYQRPHVGTTTVAASVHADCYMALRAYCDEHQLTNSGAIHHLLRVALELPPLSDLN